MKLPETVRYSYLFYSYEAEINNGGFDRFFFNSIGYAAFEIQKALDFFGLTKNKEITFEFNNKIIYNKRLNSPEVFKLIFDKNNKPLSIEYIPFDDLEYEDFNLYEK